MGSPGFMPSVEAYHSVGSVIELPENYEVCSMAEDLNFVLEGRPHTGTHG